MNRVLLFFTTITLLRAAVSPLARCGGEKGHHVPFDRCYGIPGAEKKTAHVLGRAPLGIDERLSELLEDDRDVESLRAFLTLPYGELDLLTVV